ncbi:curli production assembly/transport component CsgF [Nitrosomonas marina]|uniref:Curli production assembly/transport component CsgF n=1 Tax=Nitrosomonas marina TaxID=917 RepID=A0A1I0BDS0_9PROT|nr:curli assembly protein CsgF [Nitrosomonas marina]SET04649.1 curli production assembly/transport component CsgF [Nitrosomonas marina]
MKKLQCLLLFCWMSLSPAHATELVYTFKNPAFGGNPLNGPALLNNAQAQNDEKDPFGDQTPLEKFNETLQRSILNRLSATVAGQVIGDQGGLIPGTVETTDFIIDIVDVGGGLLTITTTDKVTGNSTSFSIDNNF